MIKVKGFYYGEKFEVVVNKKGYLKLIETEGVAVWSEEYL